MKPHVIFHSEMVVQILTHRPDSPWIVLFMNSVHRSARRRFLHMAVSQAAGNAKKTETRVCLNMMEPKMKISIHSIAILLALDLQMMKMDVLSGICIWKC